jgi:hypothetical protein
LVGVVLGITVILEQILLKIKGEVRKLMIFLLCGFGSGKIGQVSRSGMDSTIGTSSGLGSSIRRDSMKEVFSRIRSKSGSPSAVVL